MLGVRSLLERMSIILAFTTNSDMWYYPGAAGIGSCLVVTCRYANEALERGVTGPKERDGLAR